MDSPQYPKIHYHKYHQDGLAESVYKEWVAAVVELENGSLYRVCFMTALRIAQDLDSAVRSGRSYFFEPNLIVVPEIAFDSLAAAVTGVWGDGYFARMKSVEADEVHREGLYPTVP